MKFDRLVVSIRHNSAEIWWFRYGLTLLIDTLKIKARIGIRACSLCSKMLYEHSEQARAPHTNGPRDVPRCGALSLIKRL